MQDSIKSVAEIELLAEIQYMYTGWKILYHSDVSSSESKQSALT